MNNLPNTGKVFSWIRLSLGKTKYNQSDTLLMFNIELYYLGIIFSIILKFRTYFILP